MMPATTPIIVNGSIYMWVCKGVIYDGFKAM